MRIKLFWQGLLTGLVVALLGVMISTTGDFYSSKYQRNIEFGGYHIAIGIIMALVGVGLVITSVKTKNNDAKKYINMNKH